MLDQNIATLLAALIGGLLSIIGGFSASYYIHHSSDKISKRKEIRNMLEQVYKHSRSIKSSYLLIESKKILKTTSETKEANDTNFQEIDTCIAKIELLVDFYLPPLKASFSEYYSKINEIIGTGLGMEELSTATEKFHHSVIELFKKEGYSYF